MSGIVHSDVEPLRVWPAGRRKRSFGLTLVTESLILLRKRRHGKAEKNNRGSHVVAPQSAPCLARLIRLKIRTENLRVWFHAQRNDGRACAPPAKSVHLRSECYA